MRAAFTTRCTILLPRSENKKNGQVEKTFFAGETDADP